MEKKTKKIKIDFSKIFEDGEVVEIEVPLQKDRSAEIRMMQIAALQKQKDSFSFINLTKS